MVSTHSRLKAAGYGGRFKCHALRVSTHSRLKAAGYIRANGHITSLVSTHSRLKAAGLKLRSSFCVLPVSTHSRLKAAGAPIHRLRFAAFCFNTQPPEGGWRRDTKRLLSRSCFNTQPPEGGWDKAAAAKTQMTVSTHSRLKAAGIDAASRIWTAKKFQHTAA